jgi:DNA-binding transcriptional regulator YiaG
MYHYRESGLPNVYLSGGYREVQTAYGPSVVIEDVEGLHHAIAVMLVNERPHLTGPEVRFIRRYLEKTQAELGAVLGVEEQSVRRWERLARVPKPADRALRLLFLNAFGDREQPVFEELMAHAQANDEAHPQVNLRYRPRAQKKWKPEAMAA